MSKLIYVCLKNPDQQQDIVASLHRIAGEILPDNIVAEPPLIVAEDRIVFGLCNPNVSVKIEGASLCLGNILDDYAWYRLGTDQPDGSYAIFRSSPETVQVLTDIVASRTVWYFMDDEKFIASTSQRALISLLKGFEFDEQVIPWMLATGNLGPSHGWDRRIKRMGADSILTLDRASWVLSQVCHEPEFNLLQASDQEHEKRLNQALNETFSHIKLDYSQWTLLLSGGYDSRGILCLLHDFTGLKVITWGLRSSLQDSLSDAYIAKELAAHFKLPHEYFETNLSENESVEELFNRYLTCGDGAVDLIAGYMDGFAIWKMLYERGMRGIIRGDEGFGWMPVITPVDVRFRLGLPLWSDFANLKELSEFGLPAQDMPANLNQKPEESLETWRDRLYHQFRLPVVLGALSDLKLPYVEIITPLLSRKIIHTTRTLPDHLRTDKALYRTIARCLSPDIEFAQYQSLADKETILKMPKVVEFLKQELQSPQAEEVLPRAFLDYVLSQVKIESDTIEKTGAKKKSGMKKFIKALLPKWLSGSIKNTFIRPRMDFNLLAFRAYIICRMYHTLRYYR